MDTTQTTHDDEEQHTTALTRIREHIDRVGTVHIALSVVVLLVGVMGVVVAVPHIEAATSGATITTEWEKPSSGDEAVAYDRDNEVAFTTTEPGDTIYLTAYQQDGTEIFNESVPFENVNHMVYIEEKDYVLIGGTNNRLQAYRNNGDQVFATRPGYDGEHLFADYHNESGEIIAAGADRGWWIAGICASYRCG